MDPRVAERILRALDDEDSPAPWIERAFHSLALAQGNAAKVALLQRSLAYHHDDLNRFRRRASTEECDEAICVEAKTVRDAQNAKREAEREASPEPPPAG